MNLDIIRENATKRLNHGSIYAGEVTPLEAWELLTYDSAAVLVDVRTHPEWMFVGLPDLWSLGKDLIRISWQIFPEMQVNDSFVANVVESVSNLDTSIMFICRSGARSQAAAELCAKSGFTKAFNVIDGFEGGQNASGHRGLTAGWKKSDLPWVQS